MPDTQYLCLFYTTLHTCIHNYCDRIKTIKLLLTVLTVTGLKIPYICNGSFQSITILEYKELFNIAFISNYTKTNMQT